MALWGKNTNIGESESSIALVLKEYIKKEQPEVDCMSSIESNTNHCMGEEQSNEPIPFYTNDTFFNEEIPEITPLFVKVENQIEQELHVRGVSSFESEFQSNECMNVVFNKNEDIEVKPFLNMENEETQELLHEEVDIKVEKEDEWINKDDVNSVNVYGTTSTLPRSTKHTVENHNKLDGDSQTHFEKLKQHKMERLVEKQFICNQCDYVTEYSGNLKLHLMKHSGEKPYVCNQCDYKTIYSNYFKKHQMTHSGEKLFACDHCDYTTVYLHALKKHQMKHSGEKPFVCKQCDYKTLYSHALKRHQTIHTGEKSFACDQCDYKCNGNSILKQHQRQHSGEKPFVCDQCSYKTVSARNLKKHRIKHSGKKPLS